MDQQSAPHNGDERPKIEERMRHILPELTRAERQVATHVLSHFPVSALGSINTLARASDVSSPTIMRLVQKLGFKGWSDYQTALREEVGRMLVAPLSLNDTAEAQPHPLISFAQQVVANIEASLNQIPPETVTGAAALLADLDRRIVMMGGRLTHAHADYMATLLRVIRPDVAFIDDHLTDWQQMLLDLRAGDVLVLFDIRRYEANILHFAEMAAAQGAEVVLFTDRWLSPVAAHARHLLACHVEMPSAWDSTAALMMVVEGLIAQVQGLLADQVQERLNRLEDLFARTRIFRAPRMGGR